MDDHKQLLKDLDHLTEITNKFEKYNRDHLEELNTCLKDIEDHLFAHLASEENSLKGENMKKYWSKDEIDSFPF